MVKKVELRYFPRRGKTRFFLFAFVLIFQFKFFIQDENLHMEYMWLLFNANWVFWWDDDVHVVLDEHA